jgi:hypothetical protein
MCYQTTKVGLITKIVGYEIFKKVTSIHHYLNLALYWFVQMFLIRVFLA